VRLEHSRGGVEGAMEEKRVALDLNETVMRSMAIGATFKDYVCLYDPPLFSALSWGMVACFVYNFGMFAVPFVSENECYSSDNWLQHFKNVLHILSFCEGGN
jgi:hypothetical protein